MFSILFLDKILVPGNDSTNLLQCFGNNVGMCFLNMLRQRSSSGSIKINVDEHF